MEAGTEAEAVEAGTEAEECGGVLLTGFFMAYLLSLLSYTT